MKVLLLLSVLALAIASPLNADSGEDPAELILLKDAVDSKGAMCLDGSAPAYYYRPGKDSGANKWLLHLMGGGWCFLGTEDCYNRSSTIFGSSDNWTSTQEFHGALSSNKEANPAFYNWNMVFFVYCDGGSFSGNLDGPEVWNGKFLYYRGFRILNAIMDDLNMNRNLKQATDVVLTGCSAGGLAVYMHMNYIGTLIPAAAHYRGLPDAGFFIDIPSYKKNVQVSSLFKHLIQFQNIDEALMDDCKRDYPGEMLWKCMYAPYIYKYVRAPMLVLNSRYDTAQINSMFSLPCLPPHCDDDEMEYINFFEKSFMEQVSVVTDNNSTSAGYFLDSCLVHCQSMDDHPWTEFSVHSTSMSQAVYDWYYNSVPTKTQDCDYPCNPTCPGVYPPPGMTLPSTHNY